MNYTSFDYRQHCRLWYNIYLNLYQVVITTNNYTCVRTSWAQLNYSTVIEGLTQDEHVAYMYMSEPVRLLEQRLLQATGLTRRLTQNNLSLSLNKHYRND